MRSMILHGDDDWPLSEARGQYRLHRRCKYGNKNSWFGFGYGY